MYKRIPLGALTGAVFTTVYMHVILGGYCAYMLYMSGKTDLVPYYEVPTVWLAAIIGGAILGALMAGMEKPRTSGLDISRIIMLGALWLAGHGVMAYIAWPNEQEALIGIGVSAWCTGVVGVLLYRTSRQQDETETSLE